MAIEVGGVKELASLLGALPAEVRSALRPALDEAARVIADKAKENAAYSTRIPAAIYTRAKFGARTGGAVVGVDAAKAPEARVLELGNEGRRSATFRHPLFGNTNYWYPQDRQPFLFPALAEKRAEAVAIVEAAVKEAARAGGLDIA